MNAAGTAWFFIGLVAGVAATSFTMLSVISWSLWCDRFPDRHRARVRNLLNERGGE